MSMNTPFPKGYSGNPGGKPKSSIRKEFARYIDGVDEDNPATRASMIAKRIYNLTKLMDPTIKVTDKKGNIKEIKTTVKQNSVGFAAGQYISDQLMGKAHTTLSVDTGTPQINMMDLKELSSLADRICRARDQQRAFVDAQVIEEPKQIENKGII